MYFRYLIYSGREILVYLDVIISLKIVFIAISELSPKYVTEKVLWSLLLYHASDNDIRTDKDGKTLLIQLSLLKLRTFLTKWLDWKMKMMKLKVKGDLFPLHWMTLHYIAMCLFKMHHLYKAIKCVCNNMS